MSHILEILRGVLHENGVDNAFLNELSENEKISFFQQLIAEGGQNPDFTEELVEQFITELAEVIVRGEGDELAQTLLSASSKLKVEVENLKYLNQAILNQQRKELKQLLKETESDLQIDDKYVDQGIRNTERADLKDFLKKVEEGIAEPELEPAYMHSPAFEPNENTVQEGITPPPVGAKKEPKVIQMNWVRVLQIAAVVLLIMTPFFIFRPGSESSELAMTDEAAEEAKEDAVETENSVTNTTEENIDGSSETSPDPTIGIAPKRVVKSMMLEIKTGDTYGYTESADSIRLELVTFEESNDSIAKLLNTYTLKKVNDKLILSLHVLDDAEVIEIYAPSCFLGLEVSYNAVIKRQGKFYGVLKSTVTRLLEELDARFVCD